MLGQASDSDGNLLDELFELTKVLEQFQLIAALPQHTTLFVADHFPRPKVDGLLFCCALEQDSVAIATGQPLARALHNIAVAYIVA